MAGREARGFNQRWNAGGIKLLPVKWLRIPPKKEVVEWHDEIRPEFR
jgi:hypothetical protein